MDPSKHSETEAARPEGSNGVWSNILPTRRSLSYRLSSLSVRKRNNKTSLAASLPNEVLLHIFRYIQRLHMDPTGVGLRPRDDMCTLPLVCKGWYGAATNVLYHVIEFPRINSVIKFHRSLSTRPHLRKLVKVLYFPGRIGQPCPPKLYDIFVKTIALVEDLEELHTMCHIYNSENSQYSACALPIGFGRHSSLKGLHLFADGNSITRFPSLIAHQFQNLESLSLYGLNIEAISSLLLIPVLPNLVRVTIFTGNKVMETIDMWLCRLPRLSNLTLKFVPLSVTPSLFVRDNITTLELLYWTNWSQNVANWMSYMRNVRHLTLNHRVFKVLAHDTSVFPSALETLTIRMSAVGEVAGKEEFEAFANSGCAHSLLRFTIKSCRHQLWVREHEQWLQRLFEPDDGCLGEPKFFWDNETQCRCQGEVMKAMVTVFYPVNKWGWHKIRRFTSEDTRKMLEWEWPDLKKA